MTISYVQSGEELVAVFDAAGAVVGVESREVVYREGLWHGGTGILVRSGDGERIYIHRRSSEKLIYPDHYDAWAGGLIGPGESPAEAAERELAEELGITGVPLEPIGTGDYEGVSPTAVLRCHNFLYEVRWDGPVRHQPEEVSWGAWVSIPELRARLADPERWPFIPDGKLGIERWLATRSV